MTVAVLYLSKDIVILLHNNVQLNRLRAQKNIESTTIISWFRSP